jgi:hypothetical protein
MSVPKNLARFLPGFGDNSAKSNAPDHNRPERIDHHQPELSACYLNI